MNAPITALRYFQRLPWVGFPLLFALATHALAASSQGDPSLNPQSELDLKRHFVNAKKAEEDYAAEDTKTLKKWTAETAKNRRKYYRTLIANGPASTKTKEAQAEAQKKNRDYLASRNAEVEAIRKKRDAEREQRAKQAMEAAKTHGLESLNSVHPDPERAKKTTKFEIQAGPGDSENSSEPIVDQAEDSVRVIEFPGKKK